MGESNAGDRVVLHTEAGTGGANGKPRRERFCSEAKKGGSEAEAFRQEQIWKTKRIHAVLVEAPLLWSFAIERHTYMTLRDCR